MTPAEVLRAAREKIATPERWTKGLLARDAKGEEVSPQEATGSTDWMSGSDIEAVCAAETALSHALIGKQP